MHIINPPNPNKQEIFLDIIGYSFDRFNEIFKKRRALLKLKGDPASPFQWSLQDLYVFAEMKVSNILFVHKDATLIIDRWIKPAKDAKQFIIFWNDLLVHKRKNDYVFSYKDLPSDLMVALEKAKPIPAEEARA
jgi:hypothetical protein